MKIILATNNQGKVNEIKNALKQNVFSLKDLNINVEVDENKSTLIENATLKVDAIREIEPTAIIIADDTGLFVPALNYQPGVYSARYAGEQCNDNDNIDKLLEELTDSNDRSAYFETVLVVYINGKYYNFTGRLDGKIIKSRVGEQGFGYDPIFYVDEKNKTLAQMSVEEKNIIGHRGKAIRKLIESGIV